MMFYRGRLYWRPDCTRIWVNGKFFDFGRQSLASSMIVADEFDLEFIEMGVSGRTLKPSRAASQSRSSSGGRLHATSEGRPVATSSTPSGACEAPLKAFS
jgi:hypothetical protein